MSPPPPNPITSKPLNPTHPLSPTHIYILHPGSKTGKLHTSIYNLTPSLLSSYDSDKGVDAVFLESAQRVVRAHPVLEPVLVAERGRWWSDSDITLSVPDDEGSSAGVTGTMRKVAGLHAPILGWGRSTLSFTGDTYSSSNGSSTTTSADDDAVRAGQSLPLHNITIQPTSQNTRTHIFVVNSVGYAWEPPSISQSRMGSTATTTTTNISTASSNPTPSRKPGKGRNTFFEPLTPLSLYKASSTNKTEVARYTSFSGRFEVGGVLVFNHREILDSAGKSIEGSGTARETETEADQGADNEAGATGATGLVVIGTLLGVLGIRDSWVLPW
jgi:hypothetical protein